MTTPNPPSGQAIPTGDDTPRHAAPWGLRAELDRIRDDVITAAESQEARIVAEVRALCTPGRLQELATLTRELAAGVREGAEVIAWLSVHGL